jgi:methionyl-tRNA formyltransferase
MDAKEYRVVLIGNGTVAVQGLYLLKSLGISVPLVIADPSDPGCRTWRLSLVQAARESGYQNGKNLFAPKDPNDPEILSIVACCQPTLVLSLQCRRIIKEPLISIPTRGVTNLHNSPLPLLRGCDPFSWAIHDGLTKMGLSLHRIIDERVDSGPIYSQCLWDIKDTDTAWDLYVASIERGEELLRESILDICSGNLKAHSQNDCFSSYHSVGQFPFNQTEVNWSMPAVTLSRWIRSRSFPPIQLPYFRFRGVSVSIVSCRAESQRGHPSAVLSLRPFVVAARMGSLQLRALMLNGIEVSGEDVAEKLGLSAGMCLA